jgi:hypothetical protein
MGMIGLIPGLGTLRAIGIGLMFAGAASITSGLVYYAKGKTTGRAEVQAVLDKAVANANAAAAIASENYRRSEAEWQDKLAKAQTSYFERQAQHDSEIASVRAAAAADVGKLRRALAARNSASSPTAETAATASSDCASTAGGLLEEGLRVQAELAGDAERNADAVRTLLEAWPR